MKNTGFFLIIALLVFFAPQSRANYAFKCQELLNTKDENNEYKYWEVLPVTGMVSARKVHSLRNPAVAKRDILDFYLNSFFSEALLQKSEKPYDFSARCREEVEELEKLNLKSYTKHFTGSSTGICLEILKSSCETSLKEGFKAGQMFFQNIEDAIEALKIAGPRDHIILKSGGPAPVYVLMSVEVASASQTLSRLIQAERQPEAAIELHDIDAQTLKFVGTSLKGIFGKDDAAQRRFLDKQLFAEDLTLSLLRELESIALASFQLEIKPLKDAALDLLARRIFGERTLHELGGLKTPEAYMAFQNRIQIPADKDLQREIIIVGLKPRLARPEAIPIDHLDIFNALIVAYAVDGKFETRKSFQKAHSFLMSILSKNQEADEYLFGARRQKK